MPCAEAPILLWIGVTGEDIYAIPSAAEAASLICCWWHNWSRAFPIFLVRTPL